MASRKVPRLFLAMLVAAQAAAYDHPLGSHAIREAYFLGSGNQFAEALSSYTKKLPVPKTVPHVAQIEVRTTYGQVIVGSHEQFVGYSAQYAGTDYKKNPDTIQVRVEIRNTATFSLTSPVGGDGLGSRADLREGACGGLLRMHSVEQCFRDFQFRFSQEKEIEPKSSYGLSIYSDYIVVGGDVWFAFSAADIASAPFQVTVSTPDGQMVSAGFDLAALR
jgi:hypothetical protein